MLVEAPFKRGQATGQYRLAGIGLNFSVADKRRVTSAECFAHQDWNECNAGFLATPRVNGKVCKSAGPRNACFLQTKVR
jgi:hypothetical protein